MVCTYCREEVDDGVLQCNHCGSFLDNASPAVEEAQPKAQADGVWFYEENGARSKSAVSEQEISEYIAKGTISYGTSVWRQGFDQWVDIENTELKKYLNVPPPLQGTRANNTIVWFIAFAPIIGLFLEGIISGFVHDGQYVSGEFWYVTLLLNTFLCYLDERRLEKAGYNNISKIMAWIFLVPVYLYKRAGILKQSRSYFVVWIICFILMLLSE